MSDNYKEFYHATSPEAAKSIIAQRKMLRGTTGMYGGGIYFAETPQIANHKAHHTGALVKAKVKLGKVLTLNSSNSEMTFTKLKNMGYNSVQGAGGLSNPEYVVYNWAQVQIKQVEINGNVVFVGG